MLTEEFLNKIKQITGLSGIVMVLLGLLIVFFPGRTALMAGALVGCGFIVSGLFHIYSIFSLKNEKGTIKALYLLLGILYLIVGFFALVNLFAATASLFMIIGLIVGFTWLTEGFIQLMSASQFESKSWIIFSALISIVAGIIFLMSPLMSAVVLWNFLGWTFLLFGAFKLVQYFGNKI
ncbi:HdeD family acid-resistance protein [Lactococcus sp.]|uniref:HdeD family acid-resistance protein n=1 Tax=Lactococcus sp. TaxID=44273 RepID=UPI0035B4F92B